MAERHGGLVWLASFPKSGNTWTSHFLHSLIRASDRPHDINAMNTLTTGDSAAMWYRPCLEKPIEECSEDEIAEARPKAIKRIAESTDGLVFVKTHNALVSHHGTPMIEPSVTAGAIYIVRNPLDVAISYASFMNVGIDHAIELMNTEGAVVPTNAKHAYEYRGSWSEHVWSWTRRSVRQLHVMRYEDMLEKPIETFSGLARFLRIAATRGAIESAIQASSFERLKEQEDEAGFRERPETAERFFREGRSGQWGEVLTRAQIDAVVSSHRDEMARFGYSAA
jgi:hypothetical protein